MSYEKKPTNLTKRDVMEEVDALLSVAYKTEELNETATNYDVWLLLHGAIAALEICQFIATSGGLDKHLDADPVEDLSHKLQKMRKLYRELLDEGRFDG